MTQPPESLKADSERRAASAASGAAPPVPILSLPERIQTVFLSPDGLRAGWRFLMYVSLVFTTYVVLDSLLYSVPIGPLWVRLLGEVEFLAAAMLPALLMGKIERRAFGTYGFPRAHALGKLFWLGTVWGLIALSVLMLALRGAGAFDFGGLAIHGRRIFKFAAYWGVFFLLVGFFEEFLTRGYAQFTLTQGMGFWPAAVLLAIAFAAIHLDNPGETAPGIVATGCIGFFFCLTLRRTGSLWFAVGFHAAWDWSESFLYSVPDSGGLAPGHLLQSSFHGPVWLTGGSAGPEGSACVFILLVLLWIVFDRVYPEVKYGRSK